MSQDPMFSLAVGSPRSGLTWLNENGTLAVPAAGARAYMDLQPGSPAINSAGFTGCLKVSFRDQLRKLRDETCDRGAYETLTPTRTLTVNTLADTTPNGCTAQDCTLREAIQEANSSDQLAIITFDSALFASGPQTLTLQLGELRIQRSLVLQGPGADKLTLLARQSSPARHLWVDANQDKTVRISGLTFKGGRLPTDNCYGGGSIHIGTAQVIIEDSYFEGNRGGQGGAIFGGNVLLKRTTFVGNVASVGGAIYNAYGQLSVANSTFFNNQAMFGVASYCPSPAGSAIYNGNHPLNVQNTTLHKNKTIYHSSAVLISGHAGAIFNSSFGNIVIGNSIINHSLFAKRTNMASEATETPLSDIHNNCRNYGLLVSVGHNIEYNTAEMNTCELLAQADQITHPQLDVLADLPPSVIVYPVGSIPVIRLQSISPAINAGNSNICSGSLVGGRDGRGAKRPPVNCDIGAYEYGSETAEFPDTIGIFRPSSNIFHLRFSNTTSPADIAVVFGVSTDLPIAGDWNGDGRSTIGVYRPSTGTFFLKSANTFDAPVAYTFTFSGASPNSVPIAGDWDADGQAGVGLYNASTGQVLLRNALSTGFADYAMLFGMTGDLPVTGDWDGDGQDSFGIYRGDTFYLTNQVCGNNCISSANHTFVLGNVGDVPFAGDWNGNGRDGAGVFRPTNGITYFKNALTTGFADIAIVYGIAGDKPVAGVWQFSGADQADAPERPALAPTFVPRQ